MQNVQEGRRIVHALRLESTRCVKENSSEQISLIADPQIISCPEMSRACLLAVLLGALVSSEHTNRMQHRHSS